VFRSGKRGQSVLHHGCLSELLGPHPPRLTTHVLPCLHMALTPPFNFFSFFEGGNFFFIGFGFAWLIAPGIFRGNCPLGNFKGRYAGRIGRHNWTTCSRSANIVISTTYYY
jgi:hypothetical protein